MIVEEPKVEEPKEIEDVDIVQKSKKTKKRKNKDEIVSTSADELILTADAKVGQSILFDIAVCISITVDCWHFFLQKMKLLDDPAEGDIDYLTNIFEKSSKKKGVENSALVFCWDDFMPTSKEVIFM